MLEEFPKEIVEELKTKNPHFDSIVTKHDELKKRVKVREK